MLKFAKNIVPNMNPGRLFLVERTTLLVKRKIKVRGIRIIPTTPPVYAARVIIAVTLQTRLRRNPHPRKLAVKLIRKFRSRFIRRARRMLQFDKHHAPTKKPQRHRPVQLANLFRGPVTSTTLLFHRSRPHIAVTLLASPRSRSHFRTRAVKVAFRRRSLNFIRTNSKLASSKKQAPARIVRRRG
jgi:hypothetical protein